MNSVLKHALDDYKKALGSLQRNLGETKVRKRPMASLGPNAHSRFTNLRNRAPQDYREFLALANQYESERLKRDAEAAKIEQDKATADLLGANPVKLNKVVTDLEHAFKHRVRLREARPELVQGRFASAYIHALMRKDRKISPALPWNTIEMLG